MNHSNPGEEPIIQGVVLLRLAKEKGYEHTEFVSSKPSIKKLPIEKDALPLFVFPNRELDGYDQESPQKRIDESFGQPSSPLLSPKRYSYREFEKECKRIKAEKDREKMKAKFHYFVMTSELGDKTYVYCTRRSTKTNETALLLLSTMPFHSTFQRILIHIEHLHEKKTYTENTVKHLFNTLYQEIPTHEYKKKKGISLTIPISNETFGFEMPQISTSAPSWIKIKNGQPILVSHAKHTQEDVLLEEHPEQENVVEADENIKVDLIPTLLPAVKVGLRESPGKIHAFLQPNNKLIEITISLDNNTTPDRPIKLMIQPKQPIHLTLYTEEPKISVKMKPYIKPHIHLDLHYNTMVDNESSTNGSMMDDESSTNSEDDTTSIIISNYIKATLQNLINSYEPGMERSSSLISLSSDIYSDYSELPHVNDDYCYNHLQQFTFSKPKEKSLPLCDIDFRVLISSCTQRMLIQCIEGAFAERQMVFISESPRILVESLEGIMSLLYPFEWPHVYIPLLPTALTDFLEAPCPYIIGLLRQRNTNGDLLLLHDEYDIMNVDEKCLFIDLDNNTIKSHFQYFKEYDYQLEKMMYEENPKELSAPEKPPPDPHLLPFFPPSIESKLLRLLNPFYLKTRSTILNMGIMELFDGIQESLDDIEISDDLFSENMDPVNDMALEMPIDVTLRSESNLYHSSFLSSHHYSSSSDEDEEDFVPHHQSAPMTSKSRRSIFSKMELFPTSLPDALQNVPPLQVKTSHLKYLQSYHLPARMLILLPDCEENYAYHEAPATLQELCQEEYVPYIYPRVHPTTQSLRRIFIRTFLSLFKSYRLYIRETDDPSLLPFDQDKFLTEQSSEESHAFYKMFLDTQLFHFFVQKRSLPNIANRDIFDQKAFSSMNRFSIQLSILSDKSQQGWAWKLGRILKNWRYRFFVLNENMLAYYKDDSRHRPNQKRRGVIHLIPGVTRVFIPVEETFNNHSLKTQFPIVIKNPNRTLVCAFTSAQDHLNWYRLLKAKVMNKYYRDEIMKKYAVDHGFGPSAGPHYLKEQLIARQETFQVFLRRKIRKDDNEK